MHPEDHLMDRKLHIIFDLQRRQQKIIPVVRQIIRSTLDLLVYVNDPVCHITDMEILIFIFLEVKPFEIHSPPLVGQHYIHHKIPKLPALAVRQVFLEMPGIDRVDISAYIIHRTVFLLQGLLHDIEHDCEDQVQLLSQRQETVLLPSRLLGAVLDQQRIKPDILHPSGKMF